MFELPYSITVGDTEYPIRNRGDFRMVLDCFQVLNDTELPSEYRVITSLIIFYDGMTDESDIINTFGEHNIKLAVEKMYEFFNCGELTVGAVSNYKLVDWATDAQLVAGAVNAVAKKEVRAEPFLHWWTFMGYYLNIGDSAFSTIIGIRQKIKTHKNLEKYEKEFKKNNPQYFMWDSKTSEDNELDKLVRNLWDGGE